jgi:hypothetical protein
MDLTPARQMFLAAADQNPVFCESGAIALHTDFDTKTLQSDDQDIRLAHPLHRLMSKNVSAPPSAGGSGVTASKGGVNTVDESRVLHRWSSALRRAENRSASLWNPATMTMSQLLHQRYHLQDKHTIAACFSGRTRMSFEAFLFDTLEDVDW